jgi:hypothetical protein
MTSATKRSSIAASKAVGLGWSAQEQVFSVWGTIRYRPFESRNTAKAPNNNRDHLN